MKASRNNWVAAAVIAGLLIAGGAGTAWSTDFTWDGDGNSNNGGNWSTPENWNLDSSYPQTGDDNATLPAATAAGRSITVDVAVVVNNLTWPVTSYVNTLLLNNDLTVTNTLSSSGVIADFDNRLNVNGRTLTLNNKISDQQAPILSGSGRIVKQGTGTLILGYNNRTHSFSGEIIVSNGIARANNYGGNFSTCTNATVASSGGTSGTFQFDCGSTPHYLPQRYTIAGPGYNNQGALLWTQGNTGANAFTKPVTVQADATISISSGQTVEYTGTLSGSGALTLIGGGHLKIMNGNATHDGMLVISNGTLSVLGALLQVTNITILANGTLNGSQARFPLATVVNNDGGTWNSVDTTSTWSGLGDGTNWSQAANWFGDVPVNIEAIIPSTSVARNIRIDVPAHVSELTWRGGGSGTDTITLHDDLVVDVMNANVDAGVRLNVNGRTVTIYANKNNSEWNLPTFQGTGRIVKQGTNTFYLGVNNRVHSFSGEIIVSNGTMRTSDYWGQFHACTNLTVTSSGGTNGTFSFAIGAKPLYLPLRFTIAGPGYNNQGALRCTGTITLTRPITVQSDATTFISSGVTLTHSGALDGSGVMTLTGGGTYRMNNAWAYTVNGATGTGIVVSTGTVDIAGCTLTITGLETATASEYVLVDYLAANGTLVGSSFKDVIGLPETWSITYAGTTANPSAIVLSPPPRGTMIMLR